jgi:hypothetical protein
VLTGIVHSFSVELLALIKICLSLCGGLSVTLVAQIVIALKACIDINLLVNLKLAAVVGILGL